MSDGGADSDLRRRLNEAEETLRAIRDGEVDALVVRGGEREEVFTLVGGTESYRAFMEAMDMGAAALHEDGTLLYANAALCGLLERSSAQLQALGLYGALDADCARAVRTLTERARAGRQSDEVLLTLGPRKRHLVVSATPLDLGPSRGFAITFTDITERVDAAAAEESERIGRAIMASANEAVIVCDRDGVVTHATAAVRQLHDGDPVGARFEDAFPLQFGLGSGLMQPDDLVAVALGGSAVRGIEAALPANGKTRDLMISAGPLRLAEDAIGGCIITMIDMSERKAIEQQQRFLVGELGHRVKNTLALVSAISSRTLASSKSLDDFRLRFPQRIDALAATHDLLVERQWTGLSLRELLEAEVAPYLPHRSDRIEFGALDMTIPPRPAIALGLVIHELVTNAVKYGALSNDSGRVTIDASIADDGALDILWEERGGPAVVPPEKSGFGQTLIARSLGQHNGAGTSVEFRPEGVVCRMRIPAGDLK